MYWGSLVLPVHAICNILLFLLIIFLLLSRKKKKKKKKKKNLEGSYVHFIIPLFGTERYIHHVKMFFIYCNSCAHMGILSLLVNPLSYIFMLIFYYIVYGEFSTFDYSFNFLGFETSINYICNLLLLRR